MSTQKRRRTTDKVSLFSIGFKLIGSIILIVGICLSVIIIIVSKLVKDDLRIEAETNILEVNERLAAEVEYILQRTRSESMMFMQVLGGMEAGRTAAHSAVQDTIELYFEQNPQVAAFFLLSPEKRTIFWLMSISFTYGVLNLHGRKVTGKTTETRSAGPLGGKRSC